MSELKVKDLMSTELITLELSETLELAGEIMKLARVRHLPVVDGDILVGLVTHRDLLKAQVSVLASLSADERSAIESAVNVASIMNPEVRTIGPNARAVEAGLLMREHRIGCLPVVEGGALVGIVTEADFLELAVRALQDAEPYRRAN